MTDWDAGRYHRISDPQVSWGRRVVERLAPFPGERILDLGCGTGRLTAEIARTSGVFVVGLDRSAAMLAAADGVDSADTDSADSADDAGRGPARMRVRGDGAALPFRPAFDAVFSNAALHWMTDHVAVFRSVHGVLVPGGRFVAQCGGEGNLRLLLDRAHALMRSPRFAGRFRGWRDPWEFAGESATRARLARAGFEDVDVWLEPAPTMFEGPEAFAEFVSCVCVRDHLDRLRPDERGDFVAGLTAQAATDDPPFTLDYRRLNIVARKPGAR